MIEMSAEAQGILQQIATNGANANINLAQTSMGAVQEISAAMVTSTADAMNRLGTGASQVMSGIAGLIDSFSGGIDFNVGGHIGIRPSFSVQTVNVGGLFDFPIPSLGLEPYGNIKISLGGNAAVQSKVYQATSNISSGLKNMAAGLGYLASPEGLRAGLGQSPKTPSAAFPSDGSGGGGGGGKKGGGGGGGGGEAKTYDPADPEEYLSKELPSRFRDITVQLERAAKALERISDKIDNAYGKNRLALYAKANETLIESSKLYQQQRQGAITNINDAQWEMNNSYLWGMKSRGVVEGMDLTMPEAIFDPRTGRVANQDELLNFIND